MDVSEGFHGVFGEFCLAWADIEKESYRFWFLERLERVGLRDLAPTCSGFRPSGFWFLDHMSLIAQ